MGMKRCISRRASRRAGRRGDTPSASSRSRAAARRRSTRSPVGDAVGSLRRTPCPGGSSASGDHVVARVELRQQLADVRGVVLQIAVHRDDHVASRRLDSALIAAVWPKLRRNRMTRSSRLWAAMRASSANVPSREHRRRRSLRSSARASRARRRARRAAPGRSPLR